MDSELKQIVGKDEQVRRMLDDTIDLLVTRGIRPTRLNIIAAAIDHGLDQEAAEQIASAIEIRLAQRSRAA